MEQLRPPPRQLALGQGRRRKAKDCRRRRSGPQSGMLGLATAVASLRSFPDLLEEHFGSVPVTHLDWRPASWEGIPSEPFTAREQICHVRDIEIDGYQVRLRRMRDEEHPTLASIDSAALVEPRGYARSDPAEVLAAFRRARAETLAIIAA